MIKESKMDIYEINICEIINQYLDFIHSLEEKNIEETIFAQSSVEDTVIDEPDISILNSSRSNRHSLLTGKPTTL